MKNSTFIIVILLAFTLFSKNLLAQRKIEKTLSFYDGLNSSNLIKKQADFNLKGNVKQIIVHSKIISFAGIRYSNNLSKRFLTLTVNSHPKMDHNLINNY